VGNVGTAVLVDHDGAGGLSLNSRGSERVGHIDDEPSAQGTFLGTLVQIGLEGPAWGRMPHSSIRNADGQGVAARHR